MELSADLMPIYEFELANGNEVERIDQPAGTKCPFCIVFKHPLHKFEFTLDIELSPTVRYWESRDPHYPLEAGYASDVSRHAVCGPLPGLILRLLWHGAFRPNNFAVSVRSAGSSSSS